MNIVILERETGMFRPCKRDEARGLKVLNYDGLPLKCTNSIILFGRGIFEFFNIMRILPVI